MTPKQKLERFLLSDDPDVEAFLEFVEREFGRTRKIEIIMWMIRNKS